MHVIAAREDLPPIYRGRKYIFSFYLADEDDAPIPLTGYTLKAQIRTKPELLGSLIAEFTVSVTDELNGEVELILEEELTASIRASRGYYDLLVIDDSGNDDTYMKGIVEVEGSVTRNPFAFVPAYEQNIYMSDLVEAEVQ